ncbi:hypothetical protein BDZ97DRAFT_133396 [Flammula alnicola]|nr:hypothetical protein BDZ97DRAFT_133396 [Flammula alnicola]
MGPPHRNLPQTTLAPPMTPQRPQQQQQQPLEDPPPIGAQPPPENLGMSPASRYQHNLKVIRRRDPSIVSIFDQFGYVCVYHHDGAKWLKHGYEGSMFLFERSTYPPYGLYILNRHGSDDYIQAIYPEDDVIDGGKILIIKSYPDYIQRRMATIPPTETGHIPDKFSDVFAIPNVDKIERKQKGRFVTVGLWMLETNLRDSDAMRDSMIEVMLRLHSYVKRNLPYPEEFRYGPGRPPPPHRLRAPRKRAVGSNDNSEMSDSQLPAPSDSENDHSDALSASRGELSDVDKLFARLQPATSAPAPLPVASSSTVQRLPQYTPVTLDTLFASARNQAGPTIPEPPAPVSPSTTPNTGIPLLNSIFASAASPAPQRPTSTSIYSPQPSTSAAPPPQVLTLDVVSNLLGLPPTRTASAASNYSASAVSHPSSREGDNEDDGESDSPSTMFHEEENETDLRTGHNAARTAGTELLSTLGLGVPRHGLQGRINGDVTPRGPLNGLLRGPFPPAIETTSSTATVRDNVPASNAQQPAALEVNGKPRANRALVPFESDSELWPYTRGPVDEASPTDGNEDGEIVELSFEETSVLSDPDAFDKVLKNRRSAVNLSGNGNGNGMYTNGSSSRPEERSKDKGKKGKRGRKERDARAREEIERSWDLPPPSPATNRAPHTDMLFGPPASPSPCPSPELLPEIPPVPEMKTPTMTARATLAYVNGNGNGVLSPNKGKGKAVNGRTKMNGHVNGVDAETVGESVIAALEVQPYPVGKMERMEFVKEVLTLIHTDKVFVDTLWHEYMARLD